MARAYTAATIALALNATPKWVDNALSHFNLSGVEQGTQGVRRKITTCGVLELAMARSLSTALGMPLQQAIIISRRLLELGEAAVGSHLKLSLDREPYLREVAQRLEFAVEAAPLPKRGRPTGKTKRGA